jgi:hypothetical protein
VIPFGSTPDVGKFAYLEGLGVDEIVCSLPSGDRDEVLAALDKYAAVVAELRGD